MDALREAVYLRAYGQKDPLIEYKNEAYEMFVELMGNIKNEVLNNLFRSTSNLAAFENFLRNLPTHLIGPDGPMGAQPPGQPPKKPGVSSAPGQPPDPNKGLGIDLRKEPPKAGRNAPCPCGSGKKYKNCCGRTA
jgi:preprotein translocase subunit SecA